MVSEQSSLIQTSEPKCWIVYQILHRFIHQSTSLETFVIKKICNFLANVYRQIWVVDQFFHVVAAQCKSKQKLKKSKNKVLDVLVILMSIISLWTVTAMSSALNSIFSNFKSFCSFCIQSDHNCIR